MGQNFRLGGKFLLVVLFIGLCDLSWGQITTGTVLGTVRDNSGAVLPGAAIHILNTETELNRTANVDGRGTLGGNDQRECVGAGE